MKRKKDAQVEATAVPELTLSEKLLTEIRDKLG
jgi:large-conductance mechanosensitive channel